MCAVCSHNQERLLPYTTLADWFCITKDKSVYCTVHTESIHRVSQEERAKLREGVPYVKLYRYNPKHLYPKLNGFRDNGK